MAILSYDRAASECSSGAPKTASWALLSCIFLQKLSVPFGGSPLGLLFIVLIITLLIVAAHGQLLLNLTRFAVYVVFIATITISSFLADKVPSPASLFLVIGLYLPLVFQINVSREGVKQYLDYFQTGMVTIALLVIALQVIQYTIGAAYWPDLEALLPKTLTLPNYNYHRETSYMSGRFLPNGFFFLEPSILSQFLAISFIIEFDVFRRYWRMALTLLGLVAVGAGSGFLILAIAAPIAALRQTKSLVPSLIVLGILIAPIVVFTDVADPITSRFGEFSQRNSSANQRYGAPLAAMERQISEDPLRVIRGEGAGSDVLTTSANQLPITKLVREYGVLAAFALTFLIVTSLFSGGASTAVAAVVFAYYELGGGGLATPIYTVPLVLLGSLVRTTRSTDEAIVPRRSK